MLSGYGKPLVAGGLAGYGEAPTKEIKELTISPDNRRRIKEYIVL